MTLESEAKVKLITFTVNGKKVQTTEKRLKVRQVLTLAELDPETHYLVDKEADGREVEYHDLDEEIHVHDHQTFLAFFTGPTPVS